MKRARNPRWPSGPMRPSSFEPLRPVDVRVLRTALGLSRKRFADLVWVGEDTIRVWENGHSVRMRTASCVTLRQLWARTFGTMAG